MKLNCGPLCQTCEYTHAETRCPYEPNGTDIWAPGDLNKMFKRITSHPQYKKYNPQILSRPRYAKGDTKKTAPYQIGPWVVTLDFLSDLEADQLIALGSNRGYERSSDVGPMRPDGSFEKDVNEGRTSGK